jgi:solute:Na+ symporter, SSS family
MIFSTLDTVILAIYILAVLTVGFIVKRQSAAGIESYFLGKRQMPWWMLAMSGSSSYFDITGTMWIVSLFVILGLRAMWVQFMWGFIIAAFYMAFMGKWIRRSGVMTGSEWMVTRFGPGRQGDLARLSYTLYAILTIAAFLGYTAVGMGKFGVEFMPFVRALPLKPEHTCAILIIGITGIYVIVGGFRGMILVEFFQTIILTCGAIMIAALGWHAWSLGHPAAPPPADWFSFWPAWTMDRDVPADSIYHVAPDSLYYFFGLITIVYVSKGLLLCASGPEQLSDFQKFLAVRSPREASLAGMLWGVFHTVRFPMAMGVALLGISGFAAAPDLLSKISTDPEKVMPIVVAHSLPSGLRGFVMAALLSAFMGAFSAMVNGGASYAVRDVYQRYLRPDANDRELVRASYVASLAFVLVGIVISLTATSINTMLTWIMVTLGAGILLPNVMRWYWGRLNGYGYFAGTMTGMVLSLVQVIVEKADWLHEPVYITFPALALIVAVITIVVSLLTPATELEVLKKFYRTVQPAGLWREAAAAVRSDDPAFRKETPFRADLISVSLAVPWLVIMYTTPVLLVMGRLRAAAIGAAILAVLTVALFAVWWPNLPQEKTPESASPTPQSSRRSSDEP